MKVWKKLKTQKDILQMKYSANISSAHYYTLSVGEYKLWTVSESLVSSESNNNLEPIYEYAYT